MNREQMIETAARAIATSQYGDMWDNERARDTWIASASAALDAILPQVTTVEELEALPVGTKLLSEVGEVVHVAELIVGGRCRYHGLDGFSLMSADRAWDRWAAFGPLTVVWRPES